MKNFEYRLQGGHPNSLGNTVEIVEEVLAQDNLFDELFSCYFSKDKLVRLRTSNAMKRICKARKAILVPYIDRFLNEIAAIDQASVQWTLSQLFAMLDKDLNEKQKARAIRIMEYNLANHQDWIVLNQTMATLTKWSENNADLSERIKPHVERLTSDDRKSVSGRAKKMLKKLSF